MTKTEKKAKCKAILTGKQPLDMESKYFLYQIFLGHPSFEYKQGTGISDIIIGKSPRGKCFYFKRRDNSEIDISYITSIDGEKTKAKKIALACRTTIEPLIKQFRSNIWFGVDKCALTGVILTKENTHIDHYSVNFKYVVSSWITKYGEDRIYKYINENKGNDKFIKTHFTDKRVINNFIAYHNKHTNLRAVTDKANLSRKK
jgi:hypothetical protein